MKVLVTGGAGYIGSHACASLSRAGHLPVTVDNLVYGHRDAVRWGPFYQLNLDDSARIAEVCAAEKIEAIMHFAAYAYVGESVEKPLKYYQNNVSAGISLLQVALELGITKFIFSSSCATYGIPEQLPLTEASVQKPVSPYGTTKWMLEKVLDDVVQASTLRAVSLRYFNAAGARVEDGIGEDHYPETHLIPNVFRAITDKSFELSVYGNDYPNPDGSCIRDYIHVDDLAAAHVLALENIDRLAERHSKFNLGTGRGFSILEIIREAEKVSGRPVKWSFHPRRPGDPAALVADAQKVHRELGWSVTHSSLTKILTTAWQWHLRNHPGQSDQ